MTMLELMKLMAARNASDLLLSVGAAPALRIEGTLIPFGEPLDSPTLHALADSVLSEAQRSVYAARHELNLTRDEGALGRFRISFYRQRGEPALALRYVPRNVPSLDSLKMPPALRDLILLPRGLLLVVGASGAGKSTTLAAMIDYRNRSRSGHILTIEDPIEYLHQHRKSIVDQREVGPDTESFAVAMQNAMRESADVIMIGEIRDRATMEQALLYAQTGQLCLATLHATNASQALDRVLAFFPDSARNQVLMDLSMNLKAVVSQRLLRAADGGRRVPAVELLLNTSLVSDLIVKGELHQLRDAMKHGIDSGMLTFEESLFRLYSAGKVTLEEALDNADSRTDFSLRVRLAEPLSLADSDTGLSVEKSHRTDAEAEAERNAGWVDESEHARRV